MKKCIFPIFISVIISLFLSSCNNKSNQKKEQSLINTSYDLRKSLPGYIWLSTEKNFKNKNYNDSFSKYFDKNIALKEYENAAFYLMAFGKKSAHNSLYDSVYYNKTLQFYNLYKDSISSDAISHLCYYLGNNSHNNNQLEKSNEWLLKSIAEKPTNEKHKQIQGFSNFSYAQNQLNLGNHELAEKHLIDALAIFIEVNDELNQGTVYLLLHSIYMFNSAYDDAENTLKKGLEIVKTQNNEFLTSMSYGLYVHLNIAKADTLSALRYIDTFSNYINSHPESNEYQKALQNQYLTFKFIVHKNKDSATFYLNKAKKITDNVESPDLKMRTLFQEVLFANHFAEPLKNPEETEAYYNDLAKEDVPNRQFMSQLAEALFHYYQNSNNYKKANEYALFLINDISTLANERMQGKLFELEKKFQSEKKKKTILEQNNKIASRNKTIILLGSGVIVLLSGFGFFLFWYKNKTMIKENKIIQNYTSQLLNKTEEERKRIASDLHDSVSNELVNLRHTVDSNNDSIKQKIDIILEEIRSISRNLSPTLFDKIGLEQSIEQLTERFQIQHNFMITAEIVYNNSLKTAQELQLYRIIQEAITNMLKHANAIAGKITIHENEEFVMVEIKDNGTGFNVNKVLDEGKCFGLLNIKERIKFLKGKLTIQSNKNGTILQINIPK